MHWAPSPCLDKVFLLCWDVVLPRQILQPPLPPLGRHLYRQQNGRQGQTGQILESYIQNLNNYKAALTRLVLLFNKYNYIRQTVRFAELLWAHIFEEKISTMH